MSGAILGLGTATFIAGYGLAAQTPQPQEAAALLREAISAGIRYVDTAAVYGDAESVVGLVANDVHDRRVRICTKVAATAVKAGGIAAEVRASLARLRLDAVDTLLLHSADTLGLEERVLGESLDEVRSSGFALRTGASTYGVADARTALAQPWCGALQVEHSILNPSVLAALNARPHGSEIVARSVLCKGLLTSRRRHADGIASGIAPALDSLDRLAAEWGWPLPELAIRFALDTPGVDVVIVGVSTHAELRTAMSASARPPLGTEARNTLAGFDRSLADAAHPERWNAVANQAA